MKLIQQSILSFQQGKSDKVYEIDLCETAPGEYVVNFRYGRRGANLREGTKSDQLISSLSAITLSKNILFKCLMSHTKLKLLLDSIACMYYLP